jgi:ABC-2 type transport system ATP-binding protein
MPVLTRAELVASLLHNPKILFLDEPTIGLDIIVKDRIRKFIREIRKEYGTTVFLTTHDMRDIEEICDRIIILNAGEKIYDGDITNLANNLGLKCMVTVWWKGDTFQRFFQKRSNFGTLAGNLNIAHFPLL